MNKGILYRLIYEMDVPIIALRKLNEREIELWAGEKQYKYRGSGEEAEIRTLLEEIKAGTEEGKHHA